jgi:hypothetical protein
MRAQLGGTPVTVKISPETVGRYFDLTSSDLDIIDEIDKIKTEFLNYTLSVREQAMDLPDGQEKEDFVFSAQDALRETLEFLMDEFREKYFLDTGIGYEEYASLEQLHDQLEATYKIYRSYCRQFIREFYADVDSGPDHPIKRCPHCGLVWLKVEGCSGMTTCGALPESAEARVKTKYQWIRQDGKLFFLPFDVPEVIKQQIVKTRKWMSSLCKQVMGIRPTVKHGVGVGCGKKISWNDMPPVIVPLELTDVPDYANASNVRVSSEQQNAANLSKIVQELDSAKLQIDLVD